MKFEAGNLVLIDLEMAQTRCSTAISRCCGRGWEPEDLHSLLRSVAEGEWQVAQWQLGRSRCPYCNHSASKRRGEITIVALSPFLVAGIERRYWATPRAWLRLAATEGNL